MGRFSELKKLEKSIEDVHTLFMRIQNLVMEQVSYLLYKLSAKKNDIISFIE